MGLVVLIDVFLILVVVWVGFLMSLGGLAVLIEAYLLVICIVPVVMCMMRADVGVNGVVPVVDIVGILFLFLFLVGVVRVSPLLVVMG